MTGTVLDIAQAVSDVVGLKGIDSLVNNPEPHAKALLRLFNRGGSILARERNVWNGTWTVLTREHIFLTVIGQAEYALPEDCVFILNETCWNRDSYQQARGSLSPQEWQEYKSGLISSSIVLPNFRIRLNAAGLGRSFWLDRTPEARESFVFEYASKNWLVSSDGSAFHSVIQADTDRPVYDADLCELDLTWRFKQSRGLSFGAELAEFEEQKEVRLGQDANAPSIQVGGAPTRDRLQWLVPESGFGA